MSMHAVAFCMACIVSPAVMRASVAAACAAKASVADVCRASTASRRCNASLSTASAMLLRYHEREVVLGTWRARRGRLFWLATKP